jgi:hypothetical protein
MTSPVGIDTIRSRAVRKRIRDGARRQVDEDTFNMSVRKFLKTLGVTAQREIELAVREQIAVGELKGDEVLETTATVTVRGLPREVIVTGTIALS